MASTLQYQYPAPLVFKAKQQHTGTVIMLHGLGDTGQGWSEIAGAFQKELPHLKFVFPTAPRRPITLNMGSTMTGWFDINSIESINLQEDEPGLQDSRKFIEGLVRAEASSGVPSERVVVAGFSQGGAVSLLMLRSELRLAAVIGLSTWLPLHTAKVVLSEANKATPVLQCHGSNDQVVWYQYGKKSFETLQAAGANVEFKTYRGLGHSANQEELDDIKSFLHKHLPNTAASPS